MSQRDPPDRVTVPETEVRVHEIGEEVLDRLQRGETVDREAIVAAHSDLGELLRRHLALVELLHEARLDPEVSRMSREAEDRLRARVNAAGPTPRNDRGSRSNSRAGRATRAIEE